MGKQARNYSQQTLKILFARSGNQCSYPNCNTMLTNPNNALESNICHIEGANEDGERFNPNMTDKERADYNNLILLCRQHHDETNDVTKYTVENLNRMKENHENFITQSINIDKSYKEDIDSVQSLMNYMPFVQMLGIIEALPYSVPIKYTEPLDVYLGFIKGNPHLYPFNDNTLTQNFDNFINNLSYLHDILSGSTSKRNDGSYELITQNMMINGQIGNLTQCFSNYTAADMTSNIHINKRYIQDEALEFLSNEVQKQKKDLLSSYFELMNYLKSNYKSINLNSYTPYTFD